MFRKYSRGDWAILAISIILLGVSYWICRYALFDYHGMKQLPNFLAILSLVTIILASLANKVRLALMSAVGYLGGFSIGYLFQSEIINHDGLRSNNLWQLWLLGLLSFIVIGILVELFLKRKRVSK